MAFDRKTRKDTVFARTQCQDTEIETTNKTIHFDSWTAISWLKWTTSDCKPNMRRRRRDDNTGIFIGTCLCPSSASIINKYNIFFNFLSIKCFQSLDTSFRKTNAYDKFILASIHIWWSGFPVYLCTLYRAFGAPSIRIKVAYLSLTWRSSKPASLSH